MTKKELKEATKSYKTQTGDALQLLYDNLKKGQQKQLVKKEEIKNLFDRYGVNYEE